MSVSFVLKDPQSLMETIFVGSCFVAKYPEGGGNFSVVLQYLLGLRRLKKRGIWFEIMKSTGNPEEDARLAGIFRKRLAGFGFQDSYCLLVHSGVEGALQLDQVVHFGLSARQLRDLLAGPNVLLNLSYSVHPPLLLNFERRILCSIDPTEICFWMQRMEMGQSFHQEFATIGLNIYGSDCQVPATPVRWKTFFPLVDTESVRSAPRPPIDRFSTVGQWYWDGCVEWHGEWRDFSKRAAFEKFFALPARMPSAQWVLGMNLNADDPEIERITAAGWKFRHPHRFARTVAGYSRFLASSTAEFSAVKLESFSRSGWLSDRSAMYLAMGRPVITESTGAEPGLPSKSGMFFVQNLEGALDAAHEVLGNWDKHSRHARACAMECFDAGKNLRWLLA